MTIYQVTYHGYRREPSHKDLLKRDFWSFL